MRNSWLTCRCVAIGLIAALASSLAVVPAVAAADLNNTVWNTDDGSAMVKFAPCKKSLCGRIVNLSEPNGADGQPLVDKNNPDLSKRGKPIIGLTTIYDIAATGDGVWSANSYDPRSGEEHEVTLTRKGDGQLILKGCGLGGLICKSFTWTLFPPDP